MQAAEGKIAFMGDTRAIDRHQMPEQDRMRRKSRGLLQYFFKRQIGVPDECDPVFKWLRFLFDFVEPDFLQRRGSHDNRDGLRIRQDLKDAAEEGREIVLNNDDRCRCR